MDLHAIDYTIIVVYLVGVLSLGFYIGRKMKSGDDYFLAGRSLPWWAIGMSLVVTDIGAVDMVAIAGSAYLYGIVMGNFDWLGSVPVMIIGAFIFIPMFWRARVTTIPEWLGLRYSFSVRTVVALIWGAVLSISLGITLYVTALAFNLIMGITPQVIVVAENNAIFDQVVDATGEAKTHEFTFLQTIEEANKRIELLGNPNLILVDSDFADPTLIQSPEDSPVTGFTVAAVNEAWGAATMQGARKPGWNIMYSVLLMGIVIGAYTLVGGLKAVVYTDVIQCVVMMGGSFFILLYGIYYVGGISEFRSTIADLGERTMHHFDLVIPVDQEFEGEGTQLPWAGVFLGLGMVLANAYWMTNQTIVQRTLAARSEADAKASYVFGSLLKVFIPFLMVVPGIIALAHNPNIVNPDTASSMLVRDIMPVGFVGLFFAAFLAGLMSSVDSALNSASTIWTKDIYQPFFKPDADPHHYLVVGRIITVIFLFTAMICANFADGFDSIYTLIQTIFGLFQGPVLAIVVLGAIWKRATATGALVALLSGVAFSVLLNLIQAYSSEGNKLFHADDPFLYVAWWSFVWAIVTTIVVSLFTKPKTPEELKGLVYDRGRNTVAKEKSNG
ncbi:sodium/solute symporter [bacterium AH-315-P07]|nr:sodium/solute symporter [bacterium AH-315-P07]